MPPGCDDSGMALGAALLLTHNILDLPHLPRTALTSTGAYLGAPIAKGCTDDAIEHYKKEIQASSVDDIAQDAADALAENKIIGWYEGRSEVGPRALGHRSILSNPAFFDNWKRVNLIKGREEWRPFAPSVLDDDASDWFKDCPLPSPYMLFTAKVKNKKIPAITHVDDTARVQTVTEDCGNYYQLLKHFKALTGLPVLLNTSFNGPGVPIVETPEQAIEFLIQSDLDYLYIDGYRIEKK